MSKKRLDWLFSKEVTKNIDFSLKAGDWCSKEDWTLGPIQIVDINWALRAAAVLLGTSRDAGLIVWPVLGLVKHDGLAAAERAVVAIKKRHIPRMRGRHG